MKDFVISVLKMLMLVLGFGTASFAQQTPQPAPPATQAPPAEPAPQGPGYRARSLPTDTFKPSERVSEDYPVAFPADI
jgi:hypothetical protein